MTGNETKIEIQINAGGSALSVLQEMGAAVKAMDRAAAGDKYGRAGRVESAEEKLAKAERMKSAAATSGHIRNATAMFGDGGAGIVGGIGRAGAGGMVAAAGFAAAETAVKKVTSSLTVMNDSTMTAAQRQNKMVDEFVPFGRTLREFGRALSGVTDQLLRQERAHEDAIGRGRVLADTMPAYYEAAAAGQVARSHAASFAGNPLDAFRGHSYGDIASIRSAERQAAVLPARDAQVRAQRGLQAAEQNVRDAYQRASEAHKRSLGAFASAGAAGHKLKQARYNEDSSGVRNEVGINAAALAAAEANQRAVAAEAQKQAEIVRYMETRKQLSEAVRDATNANVTAMRAEVGLLQQQEQRMRGARMALGTAAPGMAQFAAGQLNDIAKNGLGNRPPDLIAQLRPFAADYIDKKVLDLGEQRNAGFQQALTDEAKKAIYGGTGENQSTVAAIQGKIAKIELADIRVTLDLDAERAGQTIAKIIGDRLDIIVRNIEVKLVADQKERDAGRARKDNTERQ